MARGKLFTFCLALLLLLGVEQTLHAAGFALYEFSARGNALGGAMVAKSDDPSAIAYNPAGLTQLDGFQVMGGVSAIIPTVHATLTNGATTYEQKSEDNVWLPPHLYGAYRLTDTLAFGVGMFSRFGLGSEFDSNWAGRYNSYDAEISTLTINPSLAWKASDKLSLGVGLDIMRFDIILKRAVDITGTPNPATDIDSKLTADGWGVGVDFGLRYAFDDQWAIGAIYRSQIQQKLDGDADFTKPAPLSGPAYSAVFNDTGVRGNVVLPDSFAFGVEYKPLPNLSLEADATWTHWSTYRSLTVNFDSPLNPLAPSTATTTSIKNWHDTWRLGFGAEYKPLDWLAVRGGYVYDEEPADDAYVDYLVPANDRQLFNAGLGFTHGKWGLDLSYTYALIMDRNIPAHATGVLDTKIHDSDFHVIGATLSYKF